MNSDKQHEGREVAVTNTLGPRNIGGILGDTFRIYGSNFLRMIAIVAIVQVLLGILGLVFALSIAGVISTFVIGGIESLSAFIGTMVIFIVIFVVISIVGYPLMEGALIHAVSEQYLRQPVSIGQAYRFAWRRLLSMIGAGILAALAVLGILAICISVAIAVSSPVRWILIPVGSVAVIYLVVCWIFICQAALLESLGPRAALSRSLALVKRNWWRVLGIMLVVGIITAAISAILGLIPLVGSIIGGILSTPIFVVASTLLYYDLRVRKEEYSLEALARELGTMTNSDVA